MAAGLGGVFLLAARRFRLNTALFHNAATGQYGLSMVTDKEPQSRAENLDGPGSPIAFYLDPGSGTPVYRQLIRQVEQSLLLGYLRAGDQLPKVKDVTASLAINPDTVLKAYRELEIRGIAKGVRGRGTFVVAVPDLPGLKAIARLRAKLVEWLGDAQAAGLTLDMTLALVNAAVHDEVSAGAQRVPGRGGAGDSADGVMA
jgi:GntR family transcriptional regulator